MDRVGQIRKGPVLTDHEKRSSHVVRLIPAVREAKVALHQSQVFKLAPYAVLLQHSKQRGSEVRTKELDEPAKAGDLAVNRVAADLGAVLLADEAKCAVDALGRDVFRRWTRLVLHPCSSGLGGGRLWVAGFVVNTARGAG